MERDDIKQEDAHELAAKEGKPLWLFALLFVGLCVLIFGSRYVAARYYSPSKHNTEQQVAKLDVDEASLPLPKSIITQKSPKKRQKAAFHEESVVSESQNEAADMKSYLEEKARKKIMFERASLLARMADAKKRAQEEEKMRQSSVLSGLGTNHTQISRKEEGAKVLGPFENPNSAFLKKEGSEKVKEEEAGLIGDLRYRITQGKIIKGVLDGAINSDLPGAIGAHVTEDVYGDQGNVILIPKGARLIGSYRSGGLRRGQDRVFIAWTRLIEPNGVTINIASNGADDLGRSGMTGSVDKHTGERYGAGIALGLLSAGASTVGVNSQDQYNSLSQYRNAVSQNMATMASSELQQSMSIQQTIRIHQGTPITIRISHDIAFEEVLREIGGRP